MALRSPAPGVDGRAVDLEVRSGTCTPQDAEQAGSGNLIGATASGALTIDPLPAGQYHVRLGNSTDNAIAFSASVNFLL